jgi:predicted SnoaL-like aldol condensation-catalyzing enzyme
METYVRQDDLEGKRNIASILSMYDSLINQKDVVATVRKYVADDYIQHNPIVKDGAEGVIEYFLDAAANFPGMHIIVYNIIGVEDLVWTRYNFLRTTDKDDLGLAGAEMFRFNKEGMCVEGWGTLQFLDDPAKALNSNGMF